MIDRSVICKKDPNAVPISKDQLSTLKNKVLTVEECQKPLRHTFEMVIQSVVNYCTFPKGTLRSQCKMYGHVLPRSQPEGVQLYCGECGAKITSMDHVRGSTAIDARHKVSSHK